MTRIWSAVKWGINGLARADKAAALDPPSPRLQVLLFATSILVTSASLLSWKLFGTGYFVPVQTDSSPQGVLLDFLWMVTIVSVAIVFYSFALYILLFRTRYRELLVSYCKGVVIASFALSVFSLFGATIAIAFGAILKGNSFLLQDLIGKLIFVSFLGVLANYLSRRSVAKFLVIGLMTFLIMVMVVIVPAQIELIGSESTPGDAP